MPFEPTMANSDGLVHRFPSLWTSFAIMGSESSAESFGGCATESQVGTVSSLSAAAHQLSIAGRRNVDPESHGHNLSNGPQPTLLPLSRVGPGSETYRLI